VAGGEQFARAGDFVREIGRTPTEFAADKFGDGREAVGSQLAEERKRRAPEEKIVEVDDCFRSDEMSERGRIVIRGFRFAPADRSVVRRVAAGVPKIGENLVGDLLGEGAERGPLAADE
jgi:hypothetical protein